VEAHSNEVIQLLAAVGASTDSMGAEDATRLWTRVGSPADPVFDEFLAQIAPTGLDGELALRVGDWRLDLSESAIRTSVLTAFVAAALIPQGLTDFAVGFVTAVLPSVFVIERVELGAGDKRLLIELRSQILSGTDDELYAALPQTTKAVVNRYDFADFLQRLREAGFTGTDEHGVITVRGWKTG
jgi:hypothetical protein